ncbi:MAG: hypothetical protein EHM24_17410 [Acidobacteria bacterium]|nr:MAG: hypothetical protein EHM24_17410 [Acidobacteriota bacterium]
MEIRQLTTIAEFEQVYALEQQVWGYTSIADAVPVPILIVSVKTGGLLLGAFDAGQMVGFAYSLPGYHDGRTFQWSHMLGVVHSHRDKGVGWRLKLEQRRLTLAAGLELIEWTYDPLQALNAHLNFTKLGIVARQYHQNVYGDSSSPLHKGTPTDRLIAEWWLRSRRVEERLAAAGDAGGRPPRLDWLATAAAANETCAGARWPRPGRLALDLDAPTLAVAIPSGFTEMQREDPALALDWRLSTRQVFEAYLPRYQVTGFARTEDGGKYLLEVRA